MDSVSLVIPAHNAERTLPSCLGALLPLLECGELAEIIVVDDSSTDATAELARKFPISVMRSQGSGPGAARNTGLRFARSDLIWFVDADCVVSPSALRTLKARLVSSRYRAVGGSYSGAMEDSLLSALIQHEIAERHSRMPESVDFLASFHLLWRRDALERLSGFDEQFQLAQDIDLAYRAKRAGSELAFESSSTVRHYHPTKLVPYFCKQTRHGFWRMALYSRFPERLSGDSYSGFVDHLQPVLALLSVLAALGSRYTGFLPAAMISGGILLLACPMGLRLLGGIGVAGLCYLPLSWIRAYARALGAVGGVAALLLAPSRRAPSTVEDAWVFGKEAAKSVSRM